MLELKSRLAWADRTPHFAPMNEKTDKPAYLVFDIETVADGRLIQRVRYPDLKELSPEQAVAKQRAELMEKSGGKSDFIPHTFQLPV